MYTKQEMLDQINDLEGLLTNIPDILYHTSYEDFMVQNDLSRMSDNATVDKYKERLKDFIIECGFLKSQQISACNNVIYTTHDRPNTSSEQTNYEIVKYSNFELVIDTDNIEDCKAKFTELTKNTENPPTVIVVGYFMNDPEQRDIFIFRRSVN